MEKNSNLSRLESLFEFIRAGDQEAFTRYALALELQKLERWSEAKAYFEEVHTHFPEYIPNYFHYSSLLYQLGQTTEALSVAQEGIQLCQKNQDKHTLIELNELAEAIEENC
jgi:tetratricopeptide (TPR) repeat protein